MFSHAPLSSLFQTAMEETSPFYNEHMLNVYIKAYMRCLYRGWFLKQIFGGKQLTVLSPWLQPVYDVAKAGLL